MENTMKLDIFFSNVKLDLPKKIGLEKTFDFIIDFALKEFKNKTL